MSQGQVLVLTGGVGGAKLALGLKHILPPHKLTAVVNTGDDFWHMGLRICPDLDTLLYTLSGKANVARGWGRAGESWSFMEAVSSLGGPSWFQLGDGDLALHILRTHALQQGQSLTHIMDGFAKAWDVDVRLLPMSNDPVMTQVRTPQGILAFQDYFVAQRCEPVVEDVIFAGAQEAHPTDAVMAALESADTKAIIIAPSNPFLSIDPILSIAPIRAALSRARAPRVAVSPIIGGRAVKGPTAKMMQEMGLSITPATIARHYHGLIDALLVDTQDVPSLDAGAFENILLGDSAILMRDLDDRARVAQAALDLALRVKR